MKGKVLLTAALFAGAAVTANAVEVLPSCETGAYGVFDEAQCAPPQETAAPEPAPVVEEPQVTEPQVAEPTYQTEPVQVTTPSQTIVEKKERIYTDWGPYKQKSPEELLAIIRKLLAEQAPAMSYPKDAPVGCCYGKLVKPPTYKEIIIKYIKEDGGYEVQVQEAQFREVEKKILVRPAYHKIEVIPAKYEIKEEKIMIAPPRAIWTYKDGIYCKVEVPPEYITIQRKVLVKPPECKKIPVPPEYKIIKVKELVRDASCTKKPLPPKYDTIRKTIMIKGPEVIWDAVLCDINLKPEEIKIIQQRLRELGYYNGPITGQLDDATMAAVVKFQVDHNLPAGNISIETLEAMGLHELAKEYLKCEIKNLMK
ncbi:MAG: peptidoglycan-binding protein [Aquificae bacterium]|nr:peptidoglycan-binding protein [Aquificota bacterium]